MKRIIAVFLMMCLVFALVACSSSGNKTDTTDTKNDTADTEVAVDTKESETSDTEDTASVPDTEEGKDKVEYVPFDYENNDLSEYVKLGQYENLTVHSSYVPLTDEEFDVIINSLLEQYSTASEITDRAAVSGDTVIANFAGYIDDEFVENTQAEDATIVITESSGYIPGFAEAFIGHEIGEDFSFDIVFPEDYRNSDLAGVTVTFKCKINKIVGDKQVPTIEQFVKDNTTFENTEDFLREYRNYYDMQSYYDDRNSMFAELWPQVTEGAELIKYPENSVEDLFEFSKQVYADAAKTYEVDYDTYLSDYLKITEDDLYARCESYIKEDLVLYSVAKELDALLTKEEYEEAAMGYAKNAGLNSIEEFMDVYGYTEHDLKSSIIWTNVMIELVERSNVVQNEVE